MRKFAVGQAVRRREDDRFLRGAGSYIDDIVLPGEARGVVVRSPHAHARIVSIDTAQAEGMPGVVKVFTARDVEAAGLGTLPSVTKIDGMDEAGVRLPPRHALTGDVVRYVGDPVAFVVAETREEAQAAAELVEVDYEPLPEVASLAHALDGDAPVIWPQLDAGNLCFHFRKGDAAAVDEAFAKADRISAVDLRNNRLVPNAMEPRGSIGDYDAEAEQYVLRMSGQAVHGQRTQLANAIFKVDPERIRVIAPDVGGGFGAKNFVYPENILVLMAARALARPVKWIAERGENFLAETHGRDHLTRAELALDAEGHFLALRVRTLANMGAYLSSYAAIIPSQASWIPMGGNYAIPAIDMDVRAVFTNTVPVDAYRGAGRPESAYVMERLVDVAAHDTGIDPCELRRRNFISSFPYRTALGAEIDCGDFADMLDRAARAADRDGFAARREASRERGRLRGLGISSYLEVTLGGPSDEAELRFDDDGGVTLLVGTQSTGQGHETAYVQLVATELGLPEEKIRYVQADTGQIPTGGGHGGSRSLMIGGSAVFRTAGEVRDKGRRAAAHLLEAGEADLEFADGIYSVVGTDHSIGLLDVEARLREADSLPEGVPETLTSRMGFTRPAVNYPNGCHICEVEVDPETGVVSLENYTVVDDFGRIVNPLIAEGQVIGGTAQGIGQALLEEAVYDTDSGQLMTGSFMDYCMPRADDFCGISVSFNEDIPSKTNPLGVKGAGEAGATGAPPAVVNAVVDALKDHGVRHLDMPLTPEKVWRAAAGIS